MSVKQQWQNTEEKRCKESVKEKGPYRGVQKQAEEYGEKIGDRKERDEAKRKATKTKMTANVSTIFEGIAGLEAHPWQAACIIVFVTKGNP